MTRKEKGKIRYVLLNIDAAIDRLTANPADRGAALGAMLDARETVEEMMAVKKKYIVNMQTKEIE